MREVRIFELEHDEPATAWRVARPSIFKVVSGEIWLTIEGDSEDHWLATGQSIELPRRAVANALGDASPAPEAVADARAEREHEVEFLEFVFGRLMNGGDDRLAGLLRELNIDRAALAARLGRVTAI